jgi:hypothetical protein
VLRHLHCQAVLSSKSITCLKRDRQSKYHSLVLPSLNYSPEVPNVGDLMTALLVLW